MKTRFFLANKNADLTSIVLTIREGTAGKNLKTLRIGTGISIESKAWDGNEDRVKRNYAGYAQINRNLVEFETKGAGLIPIC